MVADQLTRLEVGGGKKKRTIALWLALEGQGPTPLELWISRVCEEFPAYKVRDVLELKGEEYQMVRDVMEARAFAQMKRAVAQAEESDYLDKLPPEMVALVQDVEFDVIERKRRRHAVSS